MSDFASVAKRLRFALARKITEAEATFGTLGNTVLKNFSIKKTRPIERIPIIFTLPAFQHLYPYTLIYRLGLQYNIEMSQDFYILNANFDQSVFNTGCWLNIKWIDNGIVYRRFLVAHSSFYSFYTNIVNFPPTYTNEKITRKFSFEVFALFEELVGLDKNIIFNTSILVTPPTADVQSQIINVSNPFTIDELGFTLPAMLPINNSVMAYE